MSAILFLSECVESYGHSQILQVSECTFGQDELLDFS